MRAATVERRQVPVAMAASTICVTSLSVQPATQ